MLQNGKFILILIFVFAAVFILVLYLRFKDKLKTTREIERKNRELRIAYHEAEKASRLKSEFLAQMSHEIRTPINTIMSFSSLIKMELKNRLSEDMKFSFESIEKGAKRLTRTIDLILNMSDIDAGTYEAKFEKVNLMEGIISPVVNEFEINFMLNGEFVSANRIIRYQEVQGSTVTVESVRQSDLNSSEAYAIIRLFKDKLSMIQDNETIMIIEKFIIEEQEES